MRMEILLIIVGMTAVTYLPRMLPLVILSRFELPPLIRSWLSYVPVAVLAALLAPSLVAPERALAVTWNNAYLLAAVPSLAVALKTRNLMWTVLVGIVTVAALRAVGPF